MNKQLPKQPYFTNKWSILKNGSLCFAKKANTQLILCLIFMSALFVSCKTNQTLVYSTVETTAIASNINGAYILRVQGKGITYKSASENARKQAVHDIIFKNVHSSFGDHEMIFALINDPIIEQKNASFFNNFFSDNGTYKNYMEKINENEIRFSSSSTKCVIINVLVKRNELNKMLKDRNILSH